MYFLYPGNPVGHHREPTSLYGNFATKKSICVTLHCMRLSVREMDSIQIDQPTKSTQLSAQLPRSQAEMSAPLYIDNSIIYLSLNHLLSSCPSPFPLMLLIVLCIFIICMCIMCTVGNVINMWVEN